MLKRLMLLLTTFTVLFAFVTYQPKKVEANGVSTVVSFAAKQALKAATKSAVTDTVGSLALKVASKDLAEQYVKKEGLQLVVLEGGKKAMVKTAMTETQKVTLKKEIDNVIDLKIYGNSPKWVKYLDWFVGVGAVVLVGQVLYATVTGDFSGFISEIFNEAMSNLGWLVPAVQLGPNGEVPGDDPVSIPKDTPVSNPNHPTNPVPIPDYTQSLNYRDDSSNSTTLPHLTMNLSKVIDFNSLVFSYEIMHDAIYPDTRFQLPSYISFRAQGDTSSTIVDPIDLNALYQRELSIGGSPLKGQYGFPMISSYLTVKLGNTVLANNVLTPSYQTNYRMTLPSSFDLRKYNKIVFQRNHYDMDLRTVISRYFLYNTVFSVPMLYVEVSKPFSGTTVLPTPVPVDRVYVRNHNGASSTLSLNPVNIRMGAHSSMDLALNSGFLPKPEINPQTIRVPMISPKTGQIAWPQKTLLPDGYTYNPDSQTITDPAGNPVTDPATIPQKNPDPVIETSPEGNTVIDGVPTTNPAPDPVPGVDPVPPGGTNPPITTGDPKEINWAKLKAIPGIFTKKFPFSLPWDAKRFVDSVLGSIPQAKDISVKLDEIGGIHIGMDITLPDFFDPFFDFSRIITLIIFDIGLIYGLYRLLGGAS